MTASPRPAPPISPAITTIESANRIVWLTDRSSIRRASGICTFESTCQRVAPSAVAASTVFAAHAADAERRDPDRGRDRVDHRRDDRGARPDREQDHDRHQVREGGDDLHRVEHRRDRACGTVATGRRARRAACRRASESPTAANISANVSTASLPEPEHREADERGEHPERRPAAAEAEHDQRPERGRARPRSLWNSRSATRRGRRGRSRAR